MGEQTAISWTDHTFNPWMGCTKVSPACDHCYAEALGKRTGRVQWGDDAPRVPTGDPYWRNPIKWNAAAEKEDQRHRVFCASMADVFEDRRDLDPLRERLWALIEQTPYLDWQLLTKRPEHALRLMPIRWPMNGIPANLWIGSTVENQEAADARLPHLCEIPAKVRFLSCEPLLGPVSIEDFHLSIDWVICGGESGAGHRPLDLDHARALRDQCRDNGVPFFFKQVGGRTPTAGGNELDGQVWHEFPKETIQ